MMEQRLQVFLLLAIFQTWVAVYSESQDFVGLKSLEWKNIPPNWVGGDPCEADWDGISCSDNRVTSITLSSMGLEGQLSGDIDQLSELQTLDLSYNKKLTGPLPQSLGNLQKLNNLILVGCAFSGQIPGTIGSLTELVFLSLNSNRFTGLIPPSIGNLSKLYWLDLADNQLEGNIPVSSGNTPGLDMLLHCKHFHFGKNKLEGEIPEKLFNSNMTLIHVLFDSNQLTGSIPLSLGFVKSLEVLRLDGNKLSGDVPTNLNNLTNLNELILSDNKLSGLLPNFTGMTGLHFLDMSNNSFDTSDFPSSFSTLQSLTTLIMEDTNLKGPIPVELFSLPNLETVVLRKNKLNGTLDIGTSYSSHLNLVDLRNNQITKFANSDEVPSSIDIILADNLICLETTETKANYCITSVTQLSNSSYVTPPKANCNPCSSDKISSPNCLCAYPYTGTLYFRAPAFSDLDNTTYYQILENSLTTFFNKYQTKVDSIALSNPNKISSEYLNIKLQIFPSAGDGFDRDQISDIGFALSNQTYKTPKTFGPFFFIGDQYEHYADSIEVSPNSNKSSKTSIGIIVGAVVGGLAVALLLLLAGLYAYHQKKRAERATELSQPFGSWDPNSGSGAVPQLKGARWFSFEELKKYTNNFSAANNVGSGGYGKVYRGTLPTGELVAIKRSLKESMQGGVEFKTEIELLSRVHHKNLVTLVGFCFEQGEQILVYEYIPNGSLKDSLTGKSGIRLEWLKRLRVALGTARGLSYLHEHANPTIIHRDIKSTNVLLDDRLNAKVADFGLSKLMMKDGDKDHVTTQVKGTLGYLDPEYYMTQQLTEKSDVYSFGVLMLELITAKKPIEGGKYIVREIRLAMDKTKDLYNLHSFIDSNMGLGTKLIGFDKYVDLAMECVKDSAVDRPTMSDVVNEIEAIMKLAGLNPSGDSETTSASYEYTSKMSSSNPYGEDAFDHSGTFPPSKIEPQ